MVSQKFFLIVSIILTVVLFITATYAPWEYTYVKPGMTMNTFPTGYHSIFTPPEIMSAYLGARIIWPLYFIELAVLGGAVFFLWRFYLRHEWPRDDEWEYEEDHEE